MDLTQWVTKRTAIVGGPSVVRRWIGGRDGTCRRGHGDWFGRCTGRGARRAVSHNDHAHLVGEPVAVRSVRDVHRHRHNVSRRYAGYGRFGHYYNRQRRWAGIALDGNGQASFTTSTIDAGSQTVSASFGDQSGTFAQSAGTLVQRVIEADTTTTLTSSQNPSLVGDSVTFTAEVTSAGGLVTDPFGFVMFSDGSTQLGAASAQDGRVTFTTNTLTAGSHTITAAYSSGPNFQPSSGSVTQQVNEPTPTATTTTLTSSPNPSVVGDSVTLTATVTSGGSAVTEGLVSFNSDAGGQLGVATVDGNGKAVVEATLTIGGLSHEITATYQGTATLGQSSATLAQTVNLLTTGIEFTSSANPSQLGQPVTLTATVTTSDGTPVTGGDGFDFIDVSTGTQLGSTVGLGDDGKASYTTSDLTLGDHEIIAIYYGDHRVFAASNATLIQQVNEPEPPPPDGVTLTSSLNPSTEGQAVTFTASVIYNGEPQDCLCGVEFLADGVHIGSAQFRVSPPHSRPPRCCGNPRDHSPLEFVTGQLLAG